MNCYVGIFSPFLVKAMRGKVNDFYTVLKTGPKNDLLAFIGRDLMMTHDLRSRRLLDRKC